jgi:hypothetical protein
MWASFLIFKTLPRVNNKPNGRNFAQSGHPAAGPMCAVTGQVLTFRFLCIFVDQKNESPNFCPAIHHPTTTYISYL